MLELIDMNNWHLPGIYKKNKKMSFSLIFPDCFSNSLIFPWFFQNFQIPWFFPAGKNIFKFPWFSRSVGTLSLFRDTIFKLTCAFLSKLQAMIFISVFFALTENYVNVKTTVLLPMSLVKCLQLILYLDKLIFGNICFIVNTTLH